jgi:hypothetical protein
MIDDTVDSLGEAIAPALPGAVTVPEGLDGDADLGAQAAARTPDRLIFASPFWAPAALVSAGYRLDRALSGQDGRSAFNDRGADLSERLRRSGCCR